MDKEELKKNEVDNKETSKENKENKENKEEGGRPQPFIPNSGIRR